MAISRTRDLLVDVARQLFAKKGIEATTMNDIAVASKKGRRTLYTYFKSKEDVYLAVIESELDRLSQEMRKVAIKNIPPDEKILEIIYTRLDMVKEVVYRNGTLRASFFRNIWMVEACRKNFDKNEILLYREVLQEGKEKGVFNIDNINLIADILHYSIKGVEIPYIRGLIGTGIPSETSKQCVRRLVFGALGKK